MKNEWLKNLKVGDEVMYHAHLTDEYFDIRKVTGVTEDFISIDGFLFHIETGFSPYGLCEILDIHDEINMSAFENYKRLRFVGMVISKIRGMTEYELSYEQAVKIYEILKEG